MRTMLLSAQHLVPGDYIFYEDNAPYHRATTITEWEKKTKVAAFDWRALSPDRNPIENLWHKVSFERTAKD